MTPSRSKAYLLFAIPAIAASALFLVHQKRLNDRAPEVVVRQDQPMEVEPGARERAAQLRQFQNRHAREINVNLDGALLKDPTYSGALQSVTEQHVRSLEGFSDAEKEELWRATTNAQKRAAREFGKP